MSCSEKTLQVRAILNRLYMLKIKSLFLSYLPTFTSIALPDQYIEISPFLVGTIA